MAVAWGVGWSGFACVGEERGLGSERRGSWGDAVRPGGGGETGLDVDEEEDDEATIGAGGRGGKVKAGSSGQGAADEEEDEEAGAANRLDATTCAASWAVVGSIGGRRSLHCVQRRVGQDLVRQCQLA